MLDILKSTNEIKDYKERSENIEESYTETQVEEYQDMEFV
jgi:hypothetical protein